MTQSVMYGVPMEVAGIRPMCLDTLRVAWLVAKPIRTFCIETVHHPLLDFNLLLNAVRA